MVKLSASPKFSSIWRDRRGGVAVLFALGMPMIVGAAALGLEVGLWFHQKASLQKAADAAAYAGALEARSGSAYSVIQTAATNVATDNGFDDAIGDIIVNNPPTSGAHTTNKSVEVILTRNANRYFSQIFSDGPVSIRSRAVATGAPGEPACIIALDPSAAGALEFGGNSGLSLAGCNLMSNSTALDSVYAHGATTVSVPCIMTAGNVSLTGGVTQTSCAAAKTGQAQIADPYAALATPSVSGACASSSGSTLSPGRYCSNLQINNTRTLQPGLYVIDGGFLRFNANANVTGAGVTFYLANNASVNINGTAVMNLSAPTTGPYAGILFYGARTNAPSTQVNINGAASSVVTGAMYFANQEVAFAGNYEGAGGCTQIVAKTVNWTGTSQIAYDCGAYGMKGLLVGGILRLSE